MGALEEAETGIPISLQCQRIRGLAWHGISLFGRKAVMHNLAGRIGSTSLRMFQALGTAGFETAPPANMLCTSSVENPSSVNTSALCSPSAGARVGATFSCVAI